MVLEKSYLFQPHSHITGTKISFKIVNAKLNPIDRNVDWVFYFILLNNSVSLDIKQFLNSFSSEKKFYLNLPFLWTVTIDGITKDSINNVIAEAGEKWKAKISPEDMTKGGNILVAQSVSLPEEASNFAEFNSGNNMGGFLPSFGLQNRQSFLNRSFSVNFLETETDISYNLFRPWVIAMGIKGLIEQGPSLKATMTVKQYSNKGSFIRGYRFKKVFPKTVQGSTLTYEDAEFPIKSVTFACSNYEQI